MRNMIKIQELAFSDNVGLKNKRVQKVKKSWLKSEFRSVFCFYSKKTQKCCFLRKNKKKNIGSTIFKKIKRDKSSEDYIQYKRLQKQKPLCLERFQKFLNVVTKKITFSIKIQDKKKKIQEFYKIPPSVVVTKAIIWSNRRPFESSFFQ